MTISDQDAPALSLTSAGAEMTGVAPFYAGLFDPAIRLDVDGDRHSWAVFSTCRMYRYMLARMWDDYFQGGHTLVRPVLVVGMQNPSNAGATDNDPTIRRLIGFAKRLHCGGLIAVNAGARIATDPRDLRDVDDPIGPYNNYMIRAAYRMPMMAIRVAAWGCVSSKKVRDRMNGGFVQIRRHAKWCLG